MATTHAPNGLVPIIGQEEPFGVFQQFLDSDGSWKWVRGPSGTVDLQWDPDGTITITSGGGGSLPAGLDWSTPIFTVATDAANQIALRGSATGIPVGLATAGADANIDLLVSTKGLGNILLHVNNSCANSVIVSELDGPFGGDPFAQMCGGLSVIESSTESIGLPQINVIGYGATPFLVQAFANGTIGAPTKSIAGDSLGDHTYMGYGGGDHWRSFGFTTTISRVDGDAAGFNTGAQYFMIFDTVSVGLGNGANLLDFTGSTTGNPVSVASSGSDADVHIRLVPKGIDDGNGASFVVIGPASFNVDTSTFQRTDPAVLTQSASGAASDYIARVAGSGGAIFGSMVSDGTINAKTLASGGFSQYGLDAWDGAAWRGAANIVTFIDGTPAANNMPGAIDFSVNAGATGTSLFMRLQKSGVLALTSLAVNSSPPATSPGLKGGAGGATLAVRTADDTADAPLSAKTLTLSTRTGTPAKFACFDSGGKLVESAVACA